jgi:hypothetical protein
LLSVHIAVSLRRLHCAGLLLVYSRVPCKAVNAGNLLYRNMQTFASDPDEEKVQTLLELSGGTIDEARARALLRRFGGNLERASNAIFEDPGPGADEPPPLVQVTTPEPRLRAANWTSPPARRACTRPAAPPAPS